MSLHHQIWELVTMICQEKDDFRELPGQETYSSETVLNGPQVDDTITGNFQQNQEVQSQQNQEAEISRLTWAVLDGKATNAERVRLAELVSAQHERRETRA